MSSSICPCCYADGMTSFYHLSSVPSNSCILLKTAEEAKNYPRGSINLKFCHECGFVSNMDFKPKLTEYSGRYEETQGFSDTFNSFHKKLATRLIEKYDLNEKTVLEIGCGKGEFLILLSELGANKGIGFDPAYRDDHIKGVHSDRVTFIKDFYSEKYSNYKTDFVCCKMTLEHIHPTSDFIGTVRRAIGNNTDTLVFFQIPEMLRILKSCAFEDIYYEHCSYFTPGSLARLFRRNDFEVKDIDIEYDNQYLTIEAQPTSTANSQKPLPIEEDLVELEALINSFAHRSQLRIAEWNKELERYQQEAKRVVLWGSGSKGVSFLTTVQNANIIRYVVDINPYREGYYMAGTGQEIVSPAFLDDYKPDVVIVMNSIYVKEITRSLNKRGLSPTILTLN